MSGSERSKFCSQCGQHVSNLSLLSAVERAALIARAREERVCGSYFVRLSGEMVTPERPLTIDERSGVKQFGVALLSAAALAVATGCVTQSEKKSGVTSAYSEVADRQKQTDSAAVDVSDKRLEARDDEEIILLTGFIVCPPEPTWKPGRSGK
jgi:hypothetical protein